MKKTISLVLALVLIFMAGCTPATTGETKTPTEKAKEKEAKIIDGLDGEEVTMLNDRDMVEVSLEEAKAPLEIFMRQLGEDFSYREDRQFLTTAPIKKETALKTLKVGEEEKGVQVEFNRVVAPNDYLLAVQTLGNYGLRTRGYIKYQDKGIQEYSQSVMLNEELVQQGQATPEYISEQIFEDNKYRINLLGPKREELQLEDNEKLLGYEGKGLPRFEMLTTTLIKTLGVEDTLKIAKDSKYLKSIYRTEDKSQYQYMFNNNKLFEFMDGVANKLMKDNKKLYFAYKDNLKALGIIDIESPYDYEFTVENLLQMYMAKVDPTEKDNPFDAMRKALVAERGNRFDGRYTSFSMILGKTGEIKEGTFVEGEDENVRHTQLAKHYTDYITYNVTRTYIPFDISPDKETLLPSYKEAKEVEQREQVSKYTKDTTLLTTSKALAFLQFNGDTNVTRDDIKRKIEKMGGKMEYIVESDPVANYDMYANLEEGMYMGMDEKMALDREWKIDPVSYWVNQAILFNNTIQDEGKDAKPKVTYDTNGYEFYTIPTNLYSINNIISEETIEKLQAPQEQGQEAQQDLKWENEELAKVIEEGLIDNLALGTPKAQIMDTHFGKDIYKSEMKNGKVIGDYVKDKSKPTLVFFGEHWCGFCKATMKFLNENDEFWDKYNLVVITDGIAKDYEEDPEKERYSKILPNIHFEESDAMTYFGIQSYPTIIVTNPQGKAIYLENAITDYSVYENFNNKVDKLIERMSK